MRRTLPVLVAAALSLTITADAIGAGYATRTLKQGASGSDVRALQRYLDAAGYDTSADGQFGPATRGSVMAFESAEERTRERQGLARRAAHGAGSRERRRRRRGARRRRRPRRRTSAATGSPWPPPPHPTEVKVDHRGRQRDRHQAVQVRRRPRPLEGLAATTAPARSATCCTRAGLLNRARDSSGFMSWGERGRGTWITIRVEPGARLHDRRRPALRHKRPQADRQPLERADALCARLSRASPRRTLNSMAAPRA